MAVRPRPAAQDQAPHLVFLDRADAVQAVEGKGAEQAGAAARGHAVRPVSKLDKQVQHPLRHWPVERQVAGNLGAGVVGDKQRVRAGGIGWGNAKFVPPNPHFPAAAQLLCDQAHRFGILSRLGTELEVDDPDFGKR